MAVIEKLMQRLLLFCLLLMAFASVAQEKDSTAVYKKRVLESTEVDFLMSYYTQDGSNAAVTGGIGTEKLQDITPTFVVSIPLNDDDVLSVDAGISAYTSASSSNINPFDKRGSEADPFQASSGASSGDTWVNVTTTYTHNSDDRDRIWSGKLSVSSEYDYFSIGFGGSYTWLFNSKNTEFSLHGNVFLDTWNTIYPYELRPFREGGRGINDPLFNSITGNEDYSPVFTEFTSKTRNSYAVGVGFSQILSPRLQGSLAFDLVLQDGLLSTPFQRVYFQDFEDSFIENFHLADDIERLPGTRLKIAAGGRLHYYINEFLVVRTYYRYYTDDWGIQSNTASVELPVKLGQKFTVYPSYRFYNQTAADYFAPYNRHLSTSEFYTSDYDLSKFTANQYGFGLTYTDIFTSFHLGPFGMKSVDLKFHSYKRNTGLHSTIISGGIKFVID